MRKNFVGTRTTRMIYFEIMRARFRTTFSPHYPLGTKKGRLQNTDAEKLKTCSMKIEKKAGRVFFIIVYQP